MLFELKTLSSSDEIKRQMGTVSVMLLSI